MTPPSTSAYSEVQLDALRELANVASGTAATALAQMLGQEVGLDIPDVHALALGDAAQVIGLGEAAIDGVLLPLIGDIAGTVALILPQETAGVLCGMLGVDAGDEVGVSALREVGNILGCSYLGALGQMTGLSLEPAPPEHVRDGAATVVSDMLAPLAAASGMTLVLQSALSLGGQAHSISFLLLPTDGRVDALLAPLGLAD